MDVNVLISRMRKLNYTTGSIMKDKELRICSHSRMFDAEMNEAEPESGPLERLPVSHCLPGLYMPHYASVRSAVAL